MVPGPDPAFCGSPQYQGGKVAADNRVAQYGRLTIWLVRDGQSPWCWVVPQSAQVSRADGVTFVECDRTWIALRPLGVAPIVPDDGLTRQIAEGEKPKFPGHRVLASRGQADRYCGVAVEVGEAESHGSFARFRQQVLAADLDRSKLDEGIVQYKAAGGQWLGFHWNDNPHDLGVWRNGQRHDWRSHAGQLYRGYDPESPGPLVSRWGDGSLTVSAGGHTFRCTVDSEGGVTFSNQ
ncbi:MAG: hypothetical protein J5I93_20330 [Pirellulaceae bacterium]|nr:hypothetical protein [Pirellulaceae bacterium]